MKPKILFLSAPHFCNYVKNLLEYYNYSFDDKFELDFYCYESIQELTELYEKFYMDYDGFCIMGILSKKMLLHTFSKPEKPVQFIFRNTLEYYKEFFNILNSNRSISFDRVTFDFSIWFEDDPDISVPKNVEDYLNTKQLFPTSQNRITDSFTCEDIIKAEKELIEKIKKYIEEKKTDYIICSFPTTFEKVKELGIPCSFVYPSIETITDTLQILADNVKILQMNSNLPAILYVTSEDITSGNLSDINTVTLEIQQSLLNFDREFGTKFVIRPSVKGYAIYSTQNIVKQITDGFKNCQLKKYVFNQTGHEIQVGYGIGSNIITARNNASIASNLARTKNQSYIIDQTETLYGPLNSTGLNNDKEEISPVIKAAAKESHLSVSTVQRVLSVTEMLGTKNITTMDLASALHVTAANANRFLNALLSSGYAEIVDEKKNISKGRPSRVFNIKL